MNEYTRQVSLMQVQLNGESHEVESGTTVASLLDALQLDRRSVAVECNRQLVPRAEHGEALLAEGDQIEVVTLVGGG